MVPKTTEGVNIEIEKHMLEMPWIVAKQPAHKKEWKVLSSLKPLASGVWDIIGFENKARRRNSLRANKIQDQGEKPFDDR